MKDKPLRILVTDIHEWAGLGALRSLGRAGHHVVGGYPQSHKRPPGTYSRYCSDCICYPDAWMQQLEFREWLFNEARSGRYDVILPITESTILATSALRKDLSQHLLLLLPADKDLEYALSKYRATMAAQESGLPVPRTIFIRDRVNVNQCNNELSSLIFPVIIKTDNYLASDGRYVKGKAVRAATSEEAAALLEEYCKIPTGVIVQEKIPGHGVGTFLLRFDGHVQLRFAHRRLHEIPYTGGYSSLRASSHDKKTIELAERLLNAIDYEGVAMVEFIRSKRDNIPYFLEINGRLWGSIALALHAGVDFPLAMLEYQQLGHLTFKQPKYRKNLLCRNTFPGEIRYLISVFNAKKIEGEKPPSKFLAVLEFILLSLNPLIHHDHFWLNDPSPGFVAAKHTAEFHFGQIRYKISCKLRDLRDLKRLREALRRNQVHSRQGLYFSESPKSILFLCFGNICRSPFAEVYWNKRLKELGLGSPLASSAGFCYEIGRRTPSRFINLITSLGVDLSEHRSKLVTSEIVKSADAILVMDSHNYDAVKENFPDMIGKTLLLGKFAGTDEVGIRDPWPLDLPNARDCYEHLAAALEGLLKSIQKC